MPAVLNGPLQLSANRCAGVLASSAVTSQVHEIRRLIGICRVLKTTLSIHILYPKAPLQILPIVFLDFIRRTRVNVGTAASPWSE